jgi:NitT/TauT family transport system substrate-binding protein
MRKIIVTNSDRFGTSVERRKILAAGSRLALAIAVAALPSLTAIPARAQARCPNVATVRVQEWTGDIINIVPWIADAKGLFKKHCLDVKFVTLVSGPGSITALVSGSIEFANGAPDNTIRPRSKGVDIRVTSNMYVGQWSALVAGKQLALPHLDEGYPAVMKDLAGKKIGVTVLAGTTEAYVRSAFEGAGIGATSATYVAVGGVSTAVPALTAGLVDAAITGGVFPELAEALGAGRIVLDYRKKGVGPETVQALRGATLCWNAYGPYVDKNPEVVAAFTQANNEAIAWIQNPQNRNELYRVIGERMPLAISLPNREETLKRIVDIHAGLLGVGVPRESIAGWNRYLLSLKQIPSPIPYDELVWKTGRP